MIELPATWLLIIGIGVEAFLFGITQAEARFILLATSIIVILSVLLMNEHPQQLLHL